MPRTKKNPRQKLEGQISKYLTYRLNKFQDEVGFYPTAVKVSLTNLKEGPERRIGAVLVTDVRVYLDE